MSLKYALTDLRGGKRWVEADYARKADLWIVAATWEDKPVAGQRTLVQVSPTYLTLDGKIAGAPGTLNNLIGTTLRHLGAGPLWTSDDGRMTLEPVDLTARHAASSLADLIATKMGHMDGCNLDYFVPLAFAYPGKFSDEFWEKWNNALRAWVEQMRALRPSWVFVGQVHQIIDPCGALNGVYAEQDLTSFGASFTTHEADIARMKAITDLDKREMVNVVELRYPGRYPLWYQDAVKAFCERTGACLSWGRDGAALVGLAA